MTGAVVLVLALTLWFLNWHGLDYPAQVYRVELVRRYGWSLWDTHWYGGHYTPAYGLTPWLASFTGLAVLAVGSTLGSVVVFEQLLTDARLPYPATGTVTFAFLMLVNMYEGRVPFGLGVLFGLLAVACARRGRWGLAAGATLLTVLASPVAGAFVALAFGAWAATTSPRPHLRLVKTTQFRICMLALLATTVMSLTFPEGGRFPYNLTDMLIAVAAAAAVWWLLPDSPSAVRWGFALAGLAALPLFLISNPMGGNLSRLAVIGGPLLCAVPRRHVVVHGAVCLTLLGQQAYPLVRLPHAVEDPSAKVSYHQPLIDELRARTTGPVRVEIPTTESHWEAAYVAREFPLARGWERQLDLHYNGVLYDPDMTASQYHDWLVDNGVSYVAVPDATLEDEAVHEADVARGASFLRAAWSNEHWRLYKVVGSSGLVTGSARVVTMAADVVRLDVFTTAPVIVKMRYASRLMVSPQQGCVSESAGGWTRLQPSTTGRVTLQVRLFPSHDEGCPR